MTEINGRSIVKIVRARCEPFKDYFVGKKVTIIRFAPPENLVEPITAAFFKAATTSTEQKAKTFKFLGCSVDCPYLPYQTSPEEFKSLIDTTISRPNLIGIIVQNPVPRNLKSKLKRIPPTLELDGVALNHPLFKASATSEAIARLVQSFATPESLVAVVGGKGFVGSGVIRLLSESRINCLSLDYGDDLTRTLSADLVVSATGVPELLDERHLKPEHKLVVDSGFIPLNDAILGDVKRSAYSIPQNLTPVPGGVGPLQMAVLLERIIENAGLTIEKWDYHKDVIAPLQEREALAKEFLELVAQIYDSYSPEERKLIKPETWLVQGQIYSIIYDQEKLEFSISHRDRGEILKTKINSNNQENITNLVERADVESLRKYLEYLKQQQQRPRNKNQKPSRKNDELER